MKKIKYLVLVFLIVICTINIYLFAYAVPNKFYDFVYWQIGENEYKDEFLIGLDVSEDWIGNKCYIEENSDGVIKRYVWEQPVKYVGNSIIECGDINLSNMHTLLGLDNLEVLSNEGLNEKLKENGINEKIKQIDFIDPSQEIGDFLFPYTIIVTTENNIQYFFVLQRTDYGTIGKIDCNEIEFLTKEQYIESYVKKSGNLYVKGKFVSDKACFWGENVSVPIRSVLEGLGYEVSCYRNLDYGDAFRGYNIVFSNDNESCTLNTFDSSLTNTIDGSDMGWTWRCYFSNKDNMYFVPSRTLMLVASFFNKTLEIDEEGNNIYLY